MSIFDRRNDGEVAIPEIEVNGNEATVSNKDDDREEGKKVKLPKTPWF